MIVGCIGAGAPPRIAGVLTRRLVCRVRPVALTVVSVGQPDTVHDDPAVKNPITADKYPIAAPPPTACARSFPALHDGGLCGERADGLATDVPSGCPEPLKDEIPADPKP